VHVFGCLSLVVYYVARVTQLQSRSSGILLHPTSLPGPFSIGDLGAEAFAFVDFLAAAGQSFWQVLPLVPIGQGNSPYQSSSAFAGNTLLIDPRQLVVDGLVDEAELSHSSFVADSVDFEAARALKDKVLRKAFDTFARHPANFRDAFERFCAGASWWLEDFALYQALKRAHDERGWFDWESELAFRNPETLAKAGDDLKPEIEAQKFFQFLFFRRWNALRDYARKKHVKIIGDMPIFVAHDSADVWAHRDLFKLDRHGRPTVVAGVPPDYFSETGQRWGNPLYHWERSRAREFQWWIDRMRWSLSLFDLVRVDHFRGFAACWEIPAGATTAVSGEWVETPGRALFATLQKKLGELPIIAENLGIITPDVESLREEFGFPGMRVLQFAFGGDEANEHLPRNYTRDTVVYTGTHDNDTSAGWFAGLHDNERAVCLRELDSDGREVHWDMIRAALASLADTAIVPMQDVLGLGSQARMNLPASESGNWKWRMRSDALKPEHAHRLKEMSIRFERTNDAQRR
jgi:4-alpha-glucanotransferase